MLCCFGSSHANESESPPSKNHKVELPQKTSTEQHEILEKASRQQHSSSTAAPTPTPTSAEHKVSTSISEQAHVNDNKEEGDDERGRDKGGGQANPPLAQTLGASPSFVQSPPGNDGTLQRLLHGGHGWGEVGDDLSNIKARPASLRLHELNREIKNLMRIGQGAGGIVYRWALVRDSTG